MWKTDVQATCHVLRLDVAEAPMSLVGLKVHRGVVLRQAVRDLNVAAATHLKAYPSVANSK